MKMPAGVQAKKKLDKYLEEYLLEPIGGAGYPDTAAAISAVISAGGELLIPDDLADVAMAVVPGGRLIKSAQKGYKALRKGPDGKIIPRSNPKPGKSIDYDADRKKDFEEAEILEGHIGANKYNKDTQKLTMGEREKRKIAERKKGNPRVQEIIDLAKQGLWKE